MSRFNGFTFAPRASIPDAAADDTGADDLNSSHEAPSLHAGIGIGDQIDAAFLADPIDSVAFGVGAVSPVTRVLGSAVRGGGGGGVADGGIGSSSSSRRAFAIAHSYDFDGGFGSDHHASALSSYAPDSMLLSAHEAPVPAMVTETSSHLDDVFRCYVCLGRLQNAHMCPSCSKMCCFDCIAKWIAERPHCPHCRAHLDEFTLVKCRFVQEVTTELDKISHIVAAAGFEACPEHAGSALQYFCVTCSEAICSDCAMFSDTHSGHSFEKLNKVYEEHIADVGSEAVALRSRLKDLMVMMEEVESNIDRVTKAKEERAQELKTSHTAMLARLEDTMKDKLLVLLAQKGAMADEIELLESMLLELNRQLATSPKSVLIAKSGELRTMLQDLQQKPSSFEPANVAASFVSEVVPDYAAGSFRIQGYSHYRSSHEVIYSEPLHCDGLSWRLKVYPNGNGQARGSHLSVFLEMVKGSAESARYEYRVEMVSQAAPEQCVVREYVSEFEVGECWGYNKFFKIEALVKEGYIGEDDSVFLRFFVRAPTYHQKSKDQARYISALEAFQEAAVSQVASLKARLAEESFQRQRLQAGALSSSGGGSHRGGGAGSSGVDVSGGDLFSDGGDDAASEDGSAGSDGGEAPDHETSFAATEPDEETDAMAEPVTTEAPRTHRTSASYAVPSSLSDDDDAQAAAGSASLEPTPMASSALGSDIDDLDISDDADADSDNDNDDVDFVDLVSSPDGGARSSPPLTVAELDDIDPAFLVALEGLPQSPRPDVTSDDA